MPRLICLALLLLGITADAGAASFDCRKATTAVEHLVCNDAALSALDGKLGAAYATALARTSDRARLQAEQAAWLKSQRNTCGSVDCLRLVYDARLRSLADASPATSSLAIAVTAACVALRAQVSLEVRTPCTVTSSGQFGAIGNETFYYAIYCLDKKVDDNGRCEANGMAMFTGFRGTVETWHLHANDSGDDFRAPVIHRTTQGILLEEPVTIQGTGHFNDGDLFLRRGNQWIDIDTQAWQQDLEKRLPKGRAVWKGIWPDYDTLVAQTPLWHEKDGNCCPSGGGASIALALSGNRLVIKTLTLSDKPWGE